MNKDKIFCEKCNRKLVFDHIRNVLKCDYCDEYYDAIIYNGIPKEKNCKTKDNSHHTFFICKNCGATFDSFFNNTEKFCPICENLLEKNTGFQIGDFDGIYLFDIKQNRAEYEIKKFLRKQLMFPINAKKLVEFGKIRRIYVPVYKFDFDIDSVGKSFIENEQIDGYNYFKKSCQVFVPATSHFDNIINSEAFFETDGGRFLTDYCVEDLMFSADIDEKKSLLGAINIESKFAEDYLRAEAFSKNHNIENVSVTSKCVSKDSKKLLLPVWIKTYEVDGKLYRFYVNGMNGKVMGNYPKSYSKIAILFSFFAVIMFVLLLLL